MAYFDFNSTAVTHDATITQQVLVSDLRRTKNNFEVSF